MNKTTKLASLLLLSFLIAGCGTKSSQSASGGNTSSDAGGEVTDSGSTDSTPQVTTLTTEQAKQAEAGEEVIVKATVITKTDVGFFLKDDAGYIYTYVGSNKSELLDSIPTGSLVQVTGYASVYNLSHQISYKVNSDDTVTEVQVEIIEAGTGTYDVQYEECSVFDVYDSDNLDLSVYGKPVKLSGYIEYGGGDYNNPYGIVDNAGNKVLLNKYPLNGINFSSLEYKYVELTGFIYCYTATSFSVLATGAEDLPADKVTDQEAVDAAAHYLSNRFNGSKATNNLELMSEYLGASITYVSRNEAVLESNGTYHKPAEATEVIFDVTISRGEVSKSIECTVTALAITTPHLVISEMFSGGGNSKACYATDFIELYNQTDEDIDLSGYSLQNSSTGKTGSFTVHALSGVVKAHDYFLIRGGSSASDPSQFTTLEDYDLEITAFNPAASGYLVAIANTTEKIEFTYDSAGSTITKGDNIVDLLGAGSAATLFEGEKMSYSGNDKTVQRKDPEVDTDNNKNDFTFAAATPTKSSAGE